MSYELNFDGKLHFYLTHSQVLALFAIPHHEVLDMMRQRAQGELSLEPAHLKQEIICLPASCVRGKEGRHVAAVQQLDLAGIEVMVFRQGDLTVATEICLSLKDEEPRITVDRYGTKDDWRVAIDAVTPEMLLTMPPQLRRALEYCAALKREGENRKAA